MACVEKGLLLMIQLLYYYLTTLSMVNFQFDSRHPKSVDENMGMQPQQLRWRVHGRTACSQWIQDNGLVSLLSPFSLIEKSKK